MVAVDGTGGRVVYQKQYPGGAEPERFAPGERPVVLEVDGWRLGLALCRDTGIPPQAADTAALAIDVYLAAVLEHVDAAVPEDRALRIAREHGVWVVMASFAGSTGGGYGRAAGRSGIWAPDGRLVARAGSGVGEVAVAEIGG
jgi:predicted amidohydrolase